MTRVAGAILAAGASLRLGRPKQLLAFRGETLVRAVAAEVLGSICRDVAVVVGAHAAGVVRALGGLDVRVLSNRDWAEGVASSVRCSAAWAADGGHDVLVLVTCDQPLLSAAHVDRLAEVCARRREPVGSSYGGIIGVPAAFDRGSFPRLFGLSGDEGARRVLRRSAAPAVDWDEGAFDIDTPADAARFAPRSCAALETGTLNRGSRSEDGRRR